MQTGLLLLRIVVGVIVVGHGLQKLFGWFSGPGLSGAGAFFETLGHRPGRPLALIAAVSEITGGLLIVVGLLTPLGAAIVFGTLFVAAVSTFKNGFWNVNGGGEYPLVLGLVGLVIAFTGPGRYSVDDALGLELSGLQWGASAAVLALAASVPPLLRMRAARRAIATADADRTAAV